MTVDLTHDAQWIERLHDLADGILPRDAQAPVEAHVAACEACRRQLALLRTLDQSLRQTLTAPRLGVEFDSRVLQIITREPPITPIPIRRSQFELEYQSWLVSLKRALRRRWQSSIPDLIAGAAVLAVLPPVLERTMTVLSSITAGLRVPMLPAIVGPGLWVAIVAIVALVTVATYRYRTPG